MWNKLSRKLRKAIGMKLEIGKTYCFERKVEGVVMRLAGRVSKLKLQGTMFTLDECDAQGYRSTRDWQFLLVKPEALQVHVGQEIRIAPSCDGKIKTAGGHYIEPPLKMWFLAETYGTLVVVTGQKYSKFEVCLSEGRLLSLSNCGLRWKLKV